jgi:hypothetical protein
MMNRAEALRIIESALNGKQAKKAIGVFLFYHDKEGFEHEGIAYPMNKLAKMQQEYEQIINVNFKDFSNGKNDSI